MVSEMGACQLIARLITLYVFLSSGCMCFLMDKAVTCMQVGGYPCYCTVQARVDIDCSSAGYANGMRVLQSNSYFSLNQNSIYASSIDLSDNGLTDIDENAFSGIENDVYHLDLSGNNLQYLPTALSRLSRLSTLDLSGNPILSLNPTVMSAIGSTLTSLLIGLGSFISWPYEMDKLNQLQKLTMHDVKLNGIPTNAFDSFKSSLNTLNITKSMITNIPSAICDISYFQTLSFVENGQLGMGSGPMFEPCQGNRSHVKYMFITGSKMERFPLMHKTIANIDTIGFTNTNLQFINHDDLVSDSMTKRMDLKGNNLVRIPFALNKKFPSIRFLDVSDNQIRSIDELDVYNLAHLYSLNLNNNPLKYISKDAFRFNPYLTSLDLSNTQLGHIPSAVMSLNSLYLFKIDNSGVTCSCDMDYLKPWNVSSISFTTPCASTSVQISTYMRQILPTC